MTARRLVALAAVMILPISGARAQRTDNPHGERIGSCASCHAPDSWRPVRISREFKHAERVFPLEGAHARTACTGCHKSLVFSKVTNTCASCHNDVHQKELGTDCARCHTTRSFVDQGQLKRMHELSRFPLRGAHSAATCDACHAPATSGRPQYTGRTTTCLSCHDADYRRAKVPDHVASQFSRDCTSCHGNSSWRNAKFDHSVTRFPLAGGHLAASCSSCHSDNVYSGKSMECVACHRGDYDRSANPPHSPGFPTTCATCHTVDGWKGAKLDHDATRFPLTGSHRTVTCAGCHADNVYRGKPTACAACHQSKFAATTRPPHAASGIPNTCESCHATTAWTPSTFNHGATRFPLSGAHLTASCSACHGDGVYRGKPTTCISCHQKDYDAVTVPPHASLGYSKICGDCHASMTTWKGAAFNHQTFAFPLTGAHLSVSCLGCHADNVFRGKPTSCVSCHQAKYAATTNPPHSASGFSTACESCHTTSLWTTGAFSHSATSFPLEGAHAATSCTSCHGDGVYRGKPTTCISCHQRQYDAALPPHAASGFSTACKDCHASMVTWKGAVFDHQATSFPLTGAHLAVGCNGCHADNVYNGKSTACASCHQAKYSATTNPPHAAAGFSTSCESCHSSSTWLGAIFDHSTTRFPLTGAHRSTSCSGCHSDGVYRGKTMICSGCHIAKYNATTNPNHAAASFPTTCESCHTTTSWLGATFDHDGRYFPIYSGKHKDRWNTCADCHTSPTSFAVFSCFQCHLKSVMDEKHKGRAGYSYDSAKCYACHPTGSH